MAHLWLGDDHISRNIEQIRTCRPGLQSSFSEPHELLKPLLEECGFGNVVKITKCRLDWHLLTALLERWRPETHIFYLPSGECTVTLQDVSMLFDLKISGRAVTGTCGSIWETEFPRLLGDVPPASSRHGNALRTKWLKEYLQGMPNNPTCEQLMQHLRAYLLYFFGKFLLPDSSGDRVHTMYLPLLEDIQTIRSYSWGSACLASLYRGMCHAAIPSYDKNTISGCVLLLQAWAQCRISCFQRRRVRHQPAERPLALKFVAPGTTYHGDAAHNILAARTMIDHLQQNDFIWTPYNIGDSLYPEDVVCWSATTYLINFDIVEFHQTDRVRLQFGLRPFTNDCPQIMTIYHNCQRKTSYDWAEKYVAEIQYWNNRHTRVLGGDQTDDVQPTHSAQYLYNYTSQYMPYLSNDRYLNDPRPHPQYTPTPQPNQTPTPQPQNAANIINENDDDESQQYGRGLHHHQPPDCGTGSCRRH